MPQLQKRVVGYETVSVEADDLLSLSQAAQVMGLTIPGVIAAIQRGELTELVDPNAEYQQQGRRFVLREEVEAGAEARGRQSRGKDAA